jgi:hypothetical protein
LRFLVIHSVNLVVSYMMVAALCGGLGLSREAGVLASCAAFAVIGPYPDEALGIQKRLLVRSPGEGGRSQQVGIRMSVTELD